MAVFVIISYDKCSDATVISVPLIERVLKTDVLGGIVTVYESRY